MSKNKVECVSCGCYLRQKSVRKDWETRDLCVNCFKNGSYLFNYDNIKEKRFEKTQTELINFGKYKGKEFNYVFKNDNKYCKWIYNKSKGTDFGNNKFIKYLSNIYNNHGTKSTI